MNLSKQTYCGYISLSQNKEDNKYSFLLVDHHDYESSPAPLVGIFVAGKLGPSIKHDNLLWIIIAEYLTNPAIRIRLSLKG